MDKGIYLSMHSAKQLLSMQQINANNLANANTSGFKSDFIGFMENETLAHHLPTRTYTSSLGLGTHFKAGHQNSTNRPLDVAVDGPGFLLVENRLGAKTLTRRGDFSVDPNGFLVNGEGAKALDESGDAIQLPEFSSVSVGSDGVISVQSLGSAVNNLSEVGQFKLVKIDLNRIQKLADGSLSIKGLNPNQLIDSDASVRLRSGVLESSNVNPTESMVNMIELSRAFEMQLNYFEHARINSEKSERLMRVE